MGSRGGSRGETQDAMVEPWLDRGGKNRDNLEYLVLGAMDGHDRQYGKQSEVDGI